LGSDASALLLDTHAVIWMAQGTIDKRVAAIINGAAAVDGVLVSVVSAWEIGLLARPRAPGIGQLSFLPDPASWFAQLLTLKGVRLAPLTPDIAIAASFLPGSFHKDPADRLLVATARSFDIPIVTQDTAILRYAEVGNVQAIGC
jgi:PIN domain nuclease of toxin-antitoxin system